MEGRWDGTRARWRAQGKRDLIVLGSIELGGGGDLGKTDQYNTLYYLSANLENKIKSFNPSIDHPIAEVLPGGLCGGARFDRFGGNQVGGGGGNLNKINQYI